MFELQCFLPSKNVCPGKCWQYILNSPDLGGKGQGKCCKLLFNCTRLRTGVQLNDDIHARAEAVDE